MEEAYCELYQQFLRLRSLCLRQAAMLHQLTAALQKQGVTVPNGDISDMTSIPVQCTQEIPAYLHEKPQQLTMAHSPAAKRADDWLPRDVGASSNLLAEDMSKLCVEGPCQRKENEELAQNIAPLLSLESSRWQGASSSASKNLGADHLCGDRTMQTMMMPGVGDILTPPEGPLMSDVALQSHICEFCQAVFPGASTTRGEFLRHLYTHVT